MVYTQIALAAGGALASYLTASSAERAAQERAEAERKRLEEEAQEVGNRTSTQLAKLEGETNRLRRSRGRDALMEAAVMQGGRQQTQAQIGQQRQAAGLTGAARIRSAQMVAGAQAQGLLAVESARQQREQQLNQLISGNLAKAAQISQAGYAVEQQTRAQLSAARANLTAQMEAASAQKTGALISGFAGMAAAGIEHISTLPDTDDVVDIVKKVDPKVIAENQAKIGRGMSALGGAVKSGVSYLASGSLAGDVHAAGGSTDVPLLPSIDSQPQIAPELGWNTPMRQQGRDFPLQMQVGPFGGAGSTSSSRYGRGQVPFMELNRREKRGQMPPMTGAGTFGFERDAASWRQQETDFSLNKYFKTRPWPESDTRGLTDVQKRKANEWWRTRRGGQESPYTRKIWDL